MAQKVWLDNHPHLFQDPLFFELYIKELYRISQDSYLNSITDQIEKKHLIDFDIHWPHFTQKIFSITALEHNQQVIRQWLNPSNVLTQTLLSKQTTLLTNSSNLPLMLLSYTLKNGIHIPVNPPQLLYPLKLETKDSNVSSISA